MTPRSHRPLPESCRIFHRKGRTDEYARLAYAYMDSLLVAGLTEFVLVVLRIPILGTQLGVVAAAIPFGLLVVGLLLDAGRLKGPAR